ncbi:hypothetical protein BCR44DRAFT_1430935 [Catenaria anguillulae PL171]|uniref:Peptidase S54 rhomboid domain-containing protein n=1 Tax=Catenaria anguillulae PL171 TaxID=765915 RepID=A0A1Y2HU78_9FUNG|nr:hypothetical protein BCR44DRAFT_1430935 [Catenaria anguillulae PL171]
MNRFLSTISSSSMLRVRVGAKPARPQLPAPIMASRSFFTSTAGHDFKSPSRTNASLLSTLYRTQFHAQFAQMRTRATDLANRGARTTGLTATRSYRIYNNNRPRYRQFFDRYPELPLYAIIASNVGIFLLWTYAKENSRQYGDPSWLRFMLSNFMLNETNAKERPWTILTANFSHADLAHLGINMFVLHSFGTTVISTLGAPSFLALYGACALGTSLASLGYRQYNEWRMRQRLPPGWFSEKLVKASQPRGSLGASGCVMGTSVLFACLHPTATIYLMLVLPVPAWACVAGFMGYDLYRAANQSGGGTDVAGHLGGGAAGLAYWMLALRSGRGVRRW